MTVRSGIVAWTRPKIGRWTTDGSGNYDRVESVIKMVDLKKLRGTFGVATAFEDERFGHSDWSDWVVAQG